MPTKFERVKKIHGIFLLLMQLSKRWFVQRLQSYSLTLPQFVALAALASHKQACTMSDLTNVTFHDAPTMTGVIDRLVRMELVERTRSQSDRRVVLVEATTAGMALFEQIEDEMMHQIANNYDGMSEEELETLETLMRHLLSIHMKETKSLKDIDLDSEIQHLEAFVKDPIYFIKTENGKVF